ncbi:Adenylate and Guanylate cyclase catalytic domain containing protein [Tritrichomonas foetus]|uniref:Adenylate and Guanylate cyclase catalytic domain containing protein n=1 Tax=Tritrichomonas foetus TaxID=1144522 RepID=A0A1J4JLQ2_9EUKA|nr:Adenylate and Guanylate cyclase catalytic domain containing protein [Tritrichomonas foetus]|eukprot:OHS99617.1 Adenylate and Guanylate cyclase catalytic domain containing protein [Tritrichomonas foetus]
MSQNELSQGSTQRRMASGVSSQAAHRRRYNGLLKRSKFKNARDEVFRYIDYSNLMASSNRSLILFFRYFSMLQIALISILPFCKNYWRYDTLVGIITNVISVLIDIAPVKVSQHIFAIIAIIVDIILLISLFAILGSFLYFRKMAKAHRSFVNFTAIFCYGLIPYVCNLLSVYIGRSLYGIFNNDGLVYVNAVILILSLFILIPMLLVYVYFITPVIIFRPISIHFISTTPAFLFMIGNIEISIFTSLGGLLGGIEGSILMYLGLIGGALILVIYFGYYETMVTSFLIDSCGIYVACVIGIFIVTTMNLVGSKSNDGILIASVVIVIACKYGFGFYFKRVFLKLLLEIQQNDENMEFFENIKKKKFILYLRVGFENGSVSSHRWKLFELFHRRFPNDKFGTIIHAKYSAIYPDETVNLKLSLMKTILIKKGSLEMKNIIFQQFSLLQQREVSLSTTVKRLLKKTSGKVDKVRNQIRYFWECIIKGNLDELETISKKLKSDQEEIERDYNQLCIIYPNNPYVAQAYSLYLREIANNDEQAEFQEYNYRMLRQGKRISSERCYFYASREFPNLPTEEQHNSMTKTEISTVKVTDNDPKDSSAMPSSKISYSVSTYQGTETDLEGNTALIEEKMLRKYLEGMITSVHLPSMRYGPFFIFLIICLILPICFIVVILITFHNIDLVIHSINVVRYSGLLRSRFAELTVYAINAIYYNTGVTRMKSLKERWENAFKGTQPLPDNWTTDNNATIAAVINIKDLIKNINTLMPKLSESDFFEESLNILYLEQNDFYSYSNNGTAEFQKVSLEYLFTYYMGAVLNLVLADDPFEYLRRYDFQSIMRNLNNLMPSLGNFSRNVLLGTREFIVDKEQNILILAALVNSIIWAIGTGYVIFTVYMLEKEKSKIFMSFKSLPKSSLSSIITNLNSQERKVLKNEDNFSNEEQNDNNVSAQEENALRVLSTSVAKPYNWMARSGLIIFLLFLLLAAVIVSSFLIVWFSFDCFITLSRINPLFNTCPEIQAIFSKIIVDILELSSAIEYEGNDVKLPIESKPNYTAVIRNINEDIQNIASRITLLRIGSTGNNIGLRAADSVLIDLITNNMCDNISSEIVEYYQVIQCMSYEDGLSYMWGIARQVAFAASNNYLSLAFDNEEYDLLISYMLGIAKPNYTQKTIAAAAKFAQQKATKTKYLNILIPVMACMFVVIFSGALIIPVLLNNSDNGRWTLRLLLFCHSQTVISSKPISKILSNDFSENKNDSGKGEKGSSNFYESAVSHLLDAVIFFSNDLQILSANKSVDSILGLDPNEIIGKKLFDIFVAPEGNDGSLKAFIATVNGALKGQRSPSIEAEVDLIKNNEPFTVLMQLNAVSSGENVIYKATNAEGIAVLALVIRDITSQIASNKLLVDEGIKSEKLLLMILPPIIVNKIQCGEKNISFTVKSASIMFVDIVSFTPWCGSNTADYVMRTLNRLFAEFDRILKTYDRMTKIKCIGDCYMCAGGIFDEINQPSEHAKQAISYGLDIIAALKLLNIELNESLRIRVGVNSGGPIVAGVLGIEKPTFDILGPDICLAAMMEHHGVPMHVHIPQHCYELVFGSYFRIKERGDVEVKGKIYHTYIVSGYDQKD